MAESDRRRLHIFASLTLRRRGKSKKRKKLTKMQDLEPMPEEGTVLEKFESVLRSLDLPPDNARAVRNQADDLQKKWKLVCDHERKEKESRKEPEWYLERLRHVMNAKLTKKKRKATDESPSALLKSLETSLRTNPIEWVHEFLEDRNSGLTVLIEYMKLTQNSGGLQPIPSVSSASPSHAHVHANGDLPNGTLDSSFAQTSVVKEKSRTLDLRRTKSKTKELAAVKQLEEMESDIHNCIQCLRAIMNNKHGFNMVFSHQEAIFCITRSILHPSLKTKALALELLAAICLVKGGHELVTEAFDDFRRVYHEDRRYQTLVQYLTRYEEFGEFHLDFMVACMQFVNIVVHSVDDLNFRVFLQYEFHRLGLDDWLKAMESNESLELKVQMEAFQENEFDVAQLLEESNERLVYAERAEQAEASLSKTNERLQEVEASYWSQIQKLNHKIEELNGEKARMDSEQRETSTEVGTLRKKLAEKEKESLKERERLESRIDELEKLQQSLKAGLGTVSISSTAKSPATHHHQQQQQQQGKAADATRKISVNGSAASSSPPPTPPPPPSVVPPPPPCPAPSPRAQGAGSAPPPPPGPPPAPNLRAMKTPESQVDIKRREALDRYKKGHKLPRLNWSPLPVMQVKGTVFSNMDEKDVVEKLNWSEFNVLFSLGKTGPTASSDEAIPASVPVSVSGQLLGPGGKKLEKVMDDKRLRNVAITKRKVAMDPVAVMRAVHNFDLAVLSLENVDILIRILPSEEERRNFKDYETKQRPLDSLTEEDRFMYQLCKIERLPEKLHLMSFMGSFEERVKLLEPQFSALTAASSSVKNAKKFRQILKVVLAFGNYMNTGLAYGFKLDSLDRLVYLKCPQNKQVTLLHWIAQAVQEQYPDCMDFHRELLSLDKACDVSLETLDHDLAELEQGFQNAQRELALKQADSPQVLVDFVSGNNERIRGLKEDATVAKKAYFSCVEYYGENQKSTTPEQFFAHLAKFVKNFQQAAEENAERKKQEQRQREEESRRLALQEAKQARDRPAPPADGTLDVTDSRKAQQAALNLELQERLANRGAQPPGPRPRPSNPPLKIEREHLKDGTFENLIYDMKVTPYVGVAQLGTPGGQRRKSKPMVPLPRDRDRTRPAPTETAI